MTFLTRLKDDLRNPRKRTGTQNRCVINANDLRELIHHFEALDSLNRVNYENINSFPKRDQFISLITALFKNNKLDSAEIFFFVFDILKPLYEEMQKDKQIYFLRDNFKF